VNDQDIVDARRGLHAVAERVLAGPQYRRSGRIRLAVTDDGFATVAEVADGLASLTVSRGAVTREPGGIVVPLIGTVAEIAANVGVEAGAPPEAVYPPSADLPPETVLDLSGHATATVLDALIEGQRALKRLFPAEEPVLWPEHFDVSVTVDEVNYGISAGDGEHPHPYAYVGPWTPRTGAFWNDAFGASAPVDGDLERFLSEGRRLVTERGGDAAD
jgi:hypothetical protein